MPKEFHVFNKGLSYYYKDADGEVRFGCELHSAGATSATLILYKRPDCPEHFHPPEEWVSNAYSRVKAFMESRGLHVIELD